jgi:hypothetical protein
MRLASDYAIDSVRFPLVGFAGKPWDRRSVCIVAVNGSGNSLRAAESCRALGAPIVWVRDNGSVDWWTLRAGKPTRYASKPYAEFASFVHKHKADLAPEIVNRAFVAGRLPGAQQLHFVDAGLMPLLEKEDGERLGGLVEGMVRAVLRELGRPSPGKTLLRDVFAAVFRLLAGKLLRDKEVDGFANLDLEDPQSVLRKVWQHYAQDENPPSRFNSPDWKQSLKSASRLISAFGNVRVVSPETLAYVYEHTLVNKDLRKKLGIHATPPYLVDYIVWHLQDWVREIPEPDRHVFEPASGHAPFLLSAMRMLRMQLADQAPSRSHSYLKNHLHGIELDDFAREIARLSLTLGDVPNPNGWDLKEGDMFASNVLSKQAKRCHILLSNPPYEKFKDSEKKKYSDLGFAVRRKKAVEVLDRTLPHLPVGAVFGVVVPQGVLHSAEARSIRALLLQEFELRELCLFADKVFEQGDAETVVLIGRRHSGVRPYAAHVSIRRVREDSVAQFAESYRADAEYAFPMSAFAAESGYNLRVPDLPQIWEHLAQNPKLGSFADVGQGFSFAKKGLITKARAAGARQTADSVPAFLIGVHDVSIWKVPNEVWLSPSRTPVQSWRSGDFSGKPQILVNYSPVMRGPWRIKALLDEGGHAVTNTYSTVRPHSDGPSTLFLWALLNSPLANAFVYCNALKRHIYDSLIASLPLPVRWKDYVAPIHAAANEYFRAVKDPEHFKLSPDDDGAATRKALLGLDAAVLRAYNLPVRLERALLDLFRLPPSKKDARRRKGVGCKFGDYFPEDFKSIIPLHKFISESYQNSTVDRVAARVKSGRSTEVLAALRAAADAFGEET